MAKASFRSPLSRAPWTLSAAETSSSAIRRLCSLRSLASRLARSMLSAGMGRRCRRA